MSGRQPYGSIPGLCAAPARAGGATSRMSASDGLPPVSEHAAPFGPEIMAVMRDREREADEFNADLARPGSTPEENRVMRQAFAGMLWGMQYYAYNVAPLARRGPGATDATAVTPVRAKFEVAPRRRGQHPLDARRLGLLMTHVVAPPRRCPETISSGCSTRSPRWLSGISTAAATRCSPARSNNERSNARYCRARVPVVPFDAQLEDGVAASSGLPSSSPKWPRRSTMRSTHPIGIGASHWAIRNSITAAVSCSVSPDPATLDRTPM